MLPEPGVWDHRQWQLEEREQLKKEKSLEANARAKQATEARERRERERAEQDRQNAEFPDIDPQ